MSDETNCDKVLRGEVVRVTDGRLREMQEQAIAAARTAPDYLYHRHWHWAAVANELIALRAAAWGRGHQEFCTAEIDGGTPCNCIHALVGPFYSETSPTSPTPESPTK